MLECVIHKVMVELTVYMVDVVKAIKGVLCHTCILVCMCDTDQDLSVKARAKK